LFFSSSFVLSSCFLVSLFVFHHWCNTLSFHFITRCFPSLLHLIRLWAPVKPNCVQPLSLPLRLLRCTRKGSVRLLTKLIQVFYDIAKLTIPTPIPTTSPTFPKNVNKTTPQ
jgi:hypothetical protein